MSEEVTMVYIASSISFEDYVLVTDSDFSILPDWQIIFLIPGFMLDKFFLKGIYFFLGPLTTSLISFPLLSPHAHKCKLK